MRIAFRPDEILAIACHLEEEGARFYRRAADATPDPATADLLGELAEMEEEHLETFERAEQGIWGGAAEESAFDAEVALRYLRAVSQGKVVDLTGDLCARLRGCTTPESILRAAIEIEKDSVVLYAGIQAMASGRPGWHVAQSIMLEEMEHIASLSERLESLA
ncbi:MAG: ferritin family protein [Candidatus Brocadiaceae bacterium]